MIVVSRLGALLAVLMYAGAWPAEAADRTWSGTALASWSDPANWDTGAPVAGDNLIFPVGGVNKTTMNDLPAGTILGTISVTGGSYVLAGNAIQLTGGINLSGGGASVSLGVTLAASQSFVGSRYPGRSI
jgi:hypothetical protein